MRKTLKRLPKHLRQRVAACSPASDSDFYTIGIPYKVLKFLSIDDDTRRGLTAVLSLKEPIHSLHRTHPETAAELKKDAIDIGRWVDGRLQGSVRSVEDVEFSRLIAAAKASSSVKVSAALANTYSRAF